MYTHRAQFYRLSPQSCCLIPFSTEVTTISYSQNGCILQPNLGGGMSRSLSGTGLGGGSAISSVDGTIKGLLVAAAGLHHLVPRWLAVGLWVMSAADDDADGDNGDDAVANICNYFRPVGFSICSHVLLPQLWAVFADVVRELPFHVKCKWSMTSYIQVCFIDVCHCTSPAVNKET